MRHFQLYIGIPSNVLTSMPHKGFSLEHPKLLGQLTMQRAVPCGEVMPKSDQSPPLLRTFRRQLMFRSCDGKLLFRRQSEIYESLDKCTR